MKILKIKSKINKQSGILDITLFKNSEFKPSSINGVNVSVNNSKIYIKRSLKVLQSYIYRNDKILFIGVPSDVQKKIKKLTKRTPHVFIEEGIWMNGIFTNQNRVYDYIKRIDNKNIKRTLKALLKLRRYPKLVVCLSGNLETEVLQEMSKLKIPVIALSPRFENNSKVLYKVPCHANFQNKAHGNVYYGFIATLFKRYKKFVEHRKKSLAKKKTKKGKKNLNNQKRHTRKKIT